MYLIPIIVGTIAFAVLAPVVGCLLAGLDRKLSARMQGRVGPPILQPAADSSRPADGDPKMRESLVAASTRPVPSVIPPSVTPAPPQPAAPAPTRTIPVQAPAGPVSAPAAPPSSSATPAPYGPSGPSYGTQVPTRRRAERATVGRATAAL